MAVDNPFAFALLDDPLNSSLDIVVDVDMDDDVASALAFRMAVVKLLKDVGEMYAAAAATAVVEEEEVVVVELDLEKKNDESLLAHPYSFLVAYLEDIDREKIFDRKHHCLGCCTDSCCQSLDE